MISVTGGKKHDCLKCRISADGQAAPPANKATRCNKCRAQSIRIHHDIPTMCRWFSLGNYRFSTSMLVYRRVQHFAVGKHKRPAEFYRPLVFFLSLYLAPATKGDTYMVMAFHMANFFIPRTNLLHMCVYKYIYLFTKYIYIYIWICV